MVFIAGINLTEHKKQLKMAGFISINTSVQDNTFCMAMRKSDTICRSCYAYYMQTRYKRLNNALQENFRSLSEKLLTADQVESIGNYILKKSKGLRFNSIGELINDRHAINLLLIAQYIRGINPAFPITIWSKRVDLIRRNFIKNELCNVIYSNPIIDDPHSLPPEGFNAVFNVITYDYAKSHEQKPSCAGKCQDCMKCYNPVLKRDFSVIELIKRDQNKIRKGLLEEL